ncbi:2-methylcitrate dehydratase [Moorella mulderi DSM 14980]|uniref:2-methylcitrate dehydratase n=2 Tax=Neomoorella TaxID=44260 RepID=A0A151AUB4_9FIRM|nr:2-methylcitrate dehydratase [Moorella mulderi DSM 14980]
MSEFVAELSYNDLPDAVRFKAKLCLLDTLGCALGACRHPDIAKLIKAMRLLAGEGNSTIWGEEQPASLGAAIMANSSMAHTFDFDDFHKKGKVHCGAIIIPVVLAIAEHEKISGREIITAIVAGYEVMLRVAMAVDAAAHRLQGWHGTATCGTFGAAAAAGKLLGLDKYWLANALGTAGTQSGGLWAFTADGAMTKKFHAGRAAWSGTLAALMARAGFTGATKIFEAEDGGFLRAFSGNPHPDLLTDGLGENWEILKVGFKPYACCRTVHPAISAAIELSKKHNLNWEQVKEAQKIKVYTYLVAKKQNDLPLPPLNPNMAQFNLPFLVALALREGTVQVNHFNEQTIGDPDLLAVASKVDVEVDPEIERKFPEQWSCRVEIINKSGEAIGLAIESAKGDPGNPLDLAAHHDKFNGLLAVSPYSHLTSLLEEIVLKLEEEQSGQMLLSSLSL